MFTRVVNFQREAASFPDLSKGTMHITTPDNPAPPVDVIPPVDTPPIDTPPIDTPPVDVPPVDIVPPVDTPPPPAAPVVEAKPWDEVIKDVPKTDVLKKYGYDDFIINALDYYEKTGDLTPYLEAKTVDFTKMSDEQIMKYDLQSKYKTLSPEELELLYQEEVTDKYRLNREEYEAENPLAKSGLIKLKVEAQERRVAFIAKQSEFRAPEPTVDPKIAEAEQQMKLAAEKYVQFVETSEVSTSLIQNKKVVLGEGENAVNFEVKDPQTIVKSAIDTNILFDTFRDDKGNYNLNDYYATVNYAKNRKAVEAVLINHGIELGKIQAFKEKANAQAPDPTPATPTGPMTPAAALAKNGTIKAGYVGA